MFQCISQFCSILFIRMSDTNNKSNVEKSQESTIILPHGNPMVRTRGSGIISFRNNKINIDFGIMSFFENGPEYDMNKVVAKKGVSIYRYSSPIKVEGGYKISGVIFRFPEDFPSEYQIPAEVTLAHRSTLTNNSETPQVNQIEKKEKDQYSLNKPKQDIKPTECEDKKDTLVISQNTFCRIKGVALQSVKTKSYDDLMEKFLEPLKGRRFSSQTDFEGRLVNTNIVVVSLEKERIDKILSVEGEKWIQIDKYNVTLNGVEIDPIEMTWGFPVDENNLKFKSWKLLQKIY